MSLEVLTGASADLPKGQNRDYSQRRAVTGSTRVARYAGMQVATSAAVLNTITVDANTAGSRASTPNSRLPMKGVTVSATATPNTTPATAIPMPSKITINRTSRGSAPSAMRTPISWVRCCTEYAMTPYTPTAPSMLLAHVDCFLLADHTVRTPLKSVV